MAYKYASLEETIGCAKANYNGVFVPSKLHPCGWELIELNQVDGDTYVIFNENYDQDAVLREFDLESFTDTTCDLKLVDFLSESNIEYFSFDGEMSKRFKLDGKWRRVI